MPNKERSGVKAEVVIVCLRVNTHSNKKHNLKVMLTLPTYPNLTDLPIISYGNAHKVVFFRGTFIIYSK